MNTKVTITDPRGMFSDFISGGIFAKATDAEKYVNDIVAVAATRGMTGGVMADWRNVTMYFGSSSRRDTVTVKSETVR